jgi:NAD(P)-dependent dehydrogenase (short-subunit alcohol dehydrogenase family)
MPTVLITGSNRGIGYEIARQLGARGWHVLLGARDAGAGETAAADLRQSGMQVTFVHLDVDDPAGIARAVEVVRPLAPRLDVLINNAGILLREDRDILTASSEMILQYLQINAVGALQCVQAFRPLLQRGSRVIFMSSGGGSMTDPVEGWNPVYCVSKTLMNAITRHLAHALEPDGIAVNAMCPGWVRTRMGGKGATRPVEKGAETAVWLATEAAENLTGKFWRDRREIPW